MPKKNNAQRLLAEIRTSDICKGTLPKDAKPLLNFSEKSKILIVGQAPGIRAITSGKPWDDASGKRLREWMGLTEGEFYDPEITAIVPMDFCYPGKGKTGDLPPRKICADTWMQKILDELPQIQLTILISQYAQDYFLSKKKKKTLTETVKNWQDYAPGYFVLPHPSPRNNIWLKKNQWFEKNLVPKLQQKSRKITKNT